MTYGIFHLLDDDLVVLHIWNRVSNILLAALSLFIVITEEARKRGLRLSLISKYGDLIYCLLQLFGKSSLSLPHRRLVPVCLFLIHFSLLNVMNLSIIHDEISPAGTIVLIGVLQEIYDVGRSDVEAAARIRRAVPGPPVVPGCLATCCRPLPFQLKRRRGRRRRW